jgi:hypothetical protein
MKDICKITTALLAILLIVIPLLVACDDDDDDGTTEITTKPTEEATPAERVKFTLGNISDITGPAAPSLEVVDFALDDLIEHFNENNLIPGLEVAVETYDSQYDPGKAIPGYEWLLERGADVIVTGLPPIVASIHPRATKDEVALLSIVVESSAIELPTWNFAFSGVPKSYIYTLMNWIQENDPDFPTDRPAKIGGVGMVGPYAQELQAAGEAFADAHSDQWDWVGGHLLGWETVTFGPEIEALMDADYVIPPSTGFFAGSLMKEYISAGGQGKFLGTDAHNSYMAMIVESVGGWDAIDGMLFCVPNRWYNEESQVTDLMNQLLTNNHSASEAAAYKSAGSAYQGAFHMWWALLGLVKETAAQHGPDNVNSQTIYDTATSFTLEFELGGGGQRVTFSDEKRSAYDFFGIYRASGADQDLMRIGADDWWPVLLEP